MNTSPGSTQGIPISIALQPTLDREAIIPRQPGNRQRILLVSFLAILLAALISCIAKLLVDLIDLITNISFFGQFSFAPSTPANHLWGAWVIIVPAIGGVLIGLMAFYGSKAIRGHGIPEAMEQILTNQSKIKPAITYLKPLSSAISIGTGGPFGAEGPIIATGGALGSTLGQLLKISHHERKVLLAAGATAGMSAIFGSPIAAIFLAIELLLFEFSPRSIIPVALACITGAAGHHFLFEAGPVFPVAHLIGEAGNEALLLYSLLGLIIGLISILVTKIVYWIEDVFEKLPIHWMWWPAIGGLVVGVVGYIEPRSLGVGYVNITQLLSGSMALNMVFSLCLFKFISWAIALGSGTSGGTLAPLLTIGGAVGLLLGHLMLLLFPESGLSLPLAALVGMSAMFAGASRALLTSIIFALETTHQSNALLPLLATCAAAYIVSFFLMKNTIMTEKISRRGVKTPDSYEPDLLEKITVSQVFKEKGRVFSEECTVKELQEWVFNEEGEDKNHFIVTNNEGDYRGILTAGQLITPHPDSMLLGQLVQNSKSVVSLNANLSQAVTLMSEEGMEVLPVIDPENSNRVVGVLAYPEILAAYQWGMEQHEKKKPSISMKRKGLEIIVKGRILLQKRR